MITVPATMLGPLAPLLIAVALFPIPFGFDILPTTVSTSLPAVLSVYDPELGGINCDDDCRTVASGPREPWMTGAAAACPAELMGTVVTFPGVGSRICVDTGGAISARWSPYYRREVVYFDLMEDLSDGFPAWNYALVTGWSIDDRPN